MASHLSQLLDHDLSPMPLLTVFLGYWLPLDWMLRGWAALCNTTLLEKCQAVGSSILLNFMPAVLGVAFLVYLVSGLFVLARGPYRPTVRLGMNLVANFLILAITALSIRLLLSGQQSALPLVKVVVFVFVLVIFVITAVWFTTQGLFLARHLILPRWLALISLPLALGLVGREILSQQSPQQEIRDQSWRNGTLRPPDIILITMDACASRHLACYGYSRNTSPHLEALARDALLFEQFYADANWTRPGAASLLNGARPWCHEGDLGRPRQKTTEKLNLMGCLHRAGYDIRTVSSNGYADHAWQRTPIVPTEQASVSFARVPQLVFSRILPSSIYYDRVGPMLYINQFFSVPLTRDRASLPLASSKEMLGRTPMDRPSFFWVHFVIPHDPYAASDPYLGQFETSPLAREPGTSMSYYLFAAKDHPNHQHILEGRYDEALLSVDAAIGELMDWLKAHGRFDNSLVVVSSDHGESFSHGYGGHGGPLLTEDLIRVPLIIKPPGHKGAVKVTGLFEQADLAPTILHMAGLPIPAGMEGQPYPLKPDGVPVFAMNRDLSTSKHTFSLAMRQGNWKYVTHFGPWVHPWPQRELYDLDQDPNENTNLVDRRPDIAGPMHRRILEELAKRGLKPEAP